MLRENIQGMNNRDDEESLFAGEQSGAGFEIVLAT